MHPKWRCLSAVPLRADEKRHSLEQPLIAAMQLINSLAPAPKVLGMSDMPPSAHSRAINKNCGVSLGHEQVLREGPLLIDPLRFAAEAGALGHFGHFLGLVFVR